MTCQLPQESLFQDIFSLAHSQVIEILQRYNDNLVYFTLNRSLVILILFLLILSVALLCSGSVKSGPRVAVPILLGVTLVSAWIVLMGHATPSLILDSPARAAFYAAFRGGKEKDTTHLENKTSALWGTLRKNYELHKRTRVEEYCQSRNSESWTRDWFLWYKDVYLREVVVEAIMLTPSVKEPPTCDSTLYELCLSVLRMPLLIVRLLTEGAKLFLSVITLSPDIGNATLKC
jgi:hypothetical protein